MTTNKRYRSDQYVYVYLNYAFVYKLLQWMNSFFLSISLCRPNIPKFILFWFFFPLFSLFSILSRSQSKFITIKPSVKTESIIFYLEMLMKIWFDLLSHKWGKRKLIKAKRKIHYLACDSKTFTEEKKNQCFIAIYFSVWDDFRLFGLSYFSIHTKQTQNV